VINSFKDKEAEKIFHGQYSARLPSHIQRIALRKLTQLHAAANLNFLRVPPGNRLERLGGDREGQWSIRVNEQWRICFHWRNENAEDVEITDYH
jgi:toxin HigB-1